MSSLLGTQQPDLWVRNCAGGLATPHVRLLRGKWRAARAAHEAAHLRQ